MIKVKGTDFKTVIVPDLHDRVYFGQERIYSDHQYASSKDLKKYIELGKLFVLEHVPENSPSFVAPPQATVLPAPAADDRLAIVLDLVNTLKDKMEGLETRASIVEQQPVSIPEVTGILSTDNVLAAVNALQQKMESIEKGMQTAPNMTQVIQDSFKEIATQVKGLVASGPGVTSQRSVSGSSSTLEVFIPSSKIVVEDMASHVNLETKSLGQGNAMTQALSKLSQLNKK